MKPTPEQLEIQSLARSFAEGELRPHAARWDAQRALDDDVFAKLAELGFLGMTISEEFGGLGFDTTTYLVALEELAWGDAAVALSVAIHNGPVAFMVDRVGSAAQKERWLTAMASGEALGAFALSEKEAGSDAGSLRCSARKEGDGWVLNGEKVWVTNGDRAGLVLVMARVDGEGGIGAFLVPRDAPGYEVTDRATTLGLRASETVRVRLEEVRLTSQGILGEPGSGMKYALEALDVGRTGIAAQAVGVARAAMEHAVAYALERKQFGRSLAEFGAVQAKLAGMQSRIATARAMVRDAALAVEGAREPAYPRTGPDGLTSRAAVAKLVASEAATWVADEAVQIFGGYGYMRDYPVEKLLRDAKGAEIYEGTNEIMRHVIAREVLRAARAT
ncbi:MAG: acyl-CoA dehydrogenase family protein [Gemmatimonadota bacterium]